MTFSADTSGNGSGGCYWCADIFGGGWAGPFKGYEYGDGNGFGYGDGDGYGYPGENRQGAVGP
jgi:hypothetical protein